MLVAVNSGAEEPLGATTPSQKHAQELMPLEEVLRTGQEIKFEKPVDLSAILHIEKLPDGRLKFTTISLLYGNYGPTSSGPTLFSLAPPTHLNIEAGLPLLSEKDLASAEKQYADYRAKMGFSNQKDAGTVEPSSAFVLQIISSKSVAPVKKAVQKNIPRAEKSASAKQTTTPNAQQTIARALPLNTPAVLPATPAALPATPTATAPLAVPLAKPVTKALPAAPLPAAATSSSAPTPSTEETTPALAAANQSTLPPPTSFAATPGSPSNAETLYEPGKMPRGRFVDPSQFSNLAEQGLAGERLYLQGDFAVTASGQDRSVLRYQASTLSTLTPDRISKIRLIVSYPPGTTPPAEGTSVTRSQNSPLMITNVEKGKDGTVNVYVREITR